jgi:hypothetical protein
MSTKSKLNSIRARFKAQVATPESLATQYDNAPFNKPEDSIWCRWTILPGEDTKVSMGSPGASLYRTVGIAVAQLFGPLRAGDSPLWDVADKVKAAFESESFDGIVFKTPNVKRVGERNGQWQVNVTCPFHYDEIR